MNLFFNKVFSTKPFQAPVGMYLRDFAYRNRRILFTNILSSISEALLEACSLGIFFILISSLQSFPQLPYRQLKPVGDVLVNLNLAIESLSPPLFIGACLGIAILIQFAISICKYTNEVTTGYFAATARTELTYKIREIFFNMPFVDQCKVKHGDLMEYFVQSPYAILMQVESLRQAFTSALLCFVYLSSLIAISPLIFAFSIPIGGFLFGIQKILLPRIKSTSYSITEISAELNARLSEEITSFKILSLYLSKSARKIRLSNSINNLESSLKRQYKYLSIFMPASNLVPIISISVIILFSIAFLPPQADLLARLSLFVVCIQRAVNRLSVLASSLTTYSENSGRLRRLNSLLQSNQLDPVYPPSPTQYSQFKALKSTLAISIKNLDFSYPGENRPILNNVSIDIPAHTSCALVGPSGSGKSTLLNLILGLISPSSGQITLDGIKLSDFHPELWRSLVSYVGQDLSLFNSSIYENITLGNDSYDKSDVIKATKQAFIFDYIRSLPNDFETIIGDRGIKLSGGQKQRLCIARALLRKPSLLLLDEATSALDTQSERLVQDSIEQFLKGNVTSIVIAHRLSTIVNSDQIIVMDKGRVVQRGTHKSLISYPGLYQDMWNNQSRH